MIHSHDDEMKILSDLLTSKVEWKRVCGRLVATDIIDNILEFVATEIDREGGVEPVELLRGLSNTFGGVVAFIARGNSLVEALSDQYKERLADGLSSEFCKTLTNGLLVANDPFEDHRGYHAQKH